MSIDEQTNRRDSDEADLLRATEQKRLRALVEANVALARQLHSDDFQLISASGASFTKDEYLGSIESGEINYLLWEPDTIEVRLYGQAAIIRYQAQLEIVVRGYEMPLKRYWHTDTYEKHNGEWQAVWSQATEIQ